jgi:hypothetical protein
MSTSVLIVERPGQFRDGLMREVSERGAEAHVRDDAMEALAALERLAPQIVVVSDDPGPPGALGLCRLVQRKLSEAAVYRLGEPSAADQLDERSQLLPRAVGVSAIAATILGEKSNESWVAHRAWDGQIGGLELGPLLLAIEARWLSGRLLINRPGIEREIAFVRGLPVHARSTVLSERIGAVGLRHGLYDEAQLERALELGRAGGLPLGAALVELGALDPTGLFRLLCAQLIEQLTAACNSGPCHARFVLDQSVGMRHPLLRIAPLTALLHAVLALPSEDIERVLDELAERPLRGELSLAQAHWLSDLRLKDLGQLDPQTASVRTLRARLREMLPLEQDKALSADALTLTLLRAGAFEMPGTRTPAASEARAGLRTLSPPGIASAVERCARNAFETWPVSALVRARTALEQATDDYLRGQRSPEAARALALRGPEVDADPLQSEIYALSLTGQVEIRLGSTADVGRKQTVSELRLRCHARLKRLDALEREFAAALPRALLLQTRTQLERTLDALPMPDATSLRPPEPKRITSAPPSGSRRPEPISVKPSSRPPAPAPDMMWSAIEPLVQQARWSELRKLLTSKGKEPQQLMAAHALLYALASKEESKHELTDTAKPAGAAVEMLGIRAVSQLLAVPEHSAVAVVIAKRLLRRRPLDWNQPPPRRFSVLLVTAALIFGALAGLLLQPRLLNLF